MSEFHVEVVRIGPVVKHPNADTLSITEVHGGYPCIFKTGDFNEGDLAVYVPVDAMVPVARPEFAFLAAEAKGRSHVRIRARKLRGVFSMGILVKAELGDQLGVNIQTRRGIEKYEPPQEREGNGGGRSFDVTRTSRKSETAAYDRRIRLGTVLGGLGAVVTAFATGHIAPAFAAGVVAVVGEILIRRNRASKKRPNVPVYDIEGFRRHKHAFVEGEHVWITEKIHGCNARFVHTGERFHVGSRTTWRDVGDPTKHVKRDVWNDVAMKYGLEAKLKAHPGVVLFGEVYGPDCQDLHYGVEKGDVEFVAFDAMELATRRFYDVEEFIDFCDEIDVPIVPTLHKGPWSESLMKLAEGHSTLCKSHTREGFVVKPLVEAMTPGLGRKFLKLVGEGYLLRKQSEEAA